MTTPTDKQIEAAARALYGPTFDSNRYNALMWKCALRDARVALIAAMNVEEE